MQGMFIPCDVGEVRDIEVTELGQKKKLKAVDVRLSNGIDEVIATAFGDTATKAAELKGASNMWSCDISLTAAEVTKEDKKFHVQRCRLNRFEKLW